MHIEGVDENETFKLLDYESIPFAIYFPEGCNINVQNGNVLVDLRGLGYIEAPSSLYKLAYNMLNMPTEENLKSGYAWLGEYNVHLFIIYWRLENMEARDGFGPRSNIIFKEWIWKDTGKRLESLFEN